MVEITESFQIISSTSAYLEGVLFVLMIFCGMKYFSLLKQRDTKEEKLMLYGFSFYFFGYAIAKLLWYFSRFQLINTINNGIFYGSFELLTDQYLLLDKAGEIFLLLAQFSIIFSFERILNKTRNILSIVIIICIVITVFLPYESSRDLIILFTGFNQALIIFCVILMARWSRL